ncbi:hypothetical protein BJ508DRAFT_303550 [Ascobolus immersus RN42]|uniref:Uncharacterized protein n=1 Tax=Ascobolus immersus RN42 TaxID=1160509 RepID=A0A3N4IJB5_ASCIM|nr:hypothetical protein BJ508DRAFT_303550 [Ascobolus immersus RN42]
MGNVSCGIFRAIRGRRQPDMECTQAAHYDDRIIVYMTSECQDSEIERVIVKEAGMSLLKSTKMEVSVWERTQSQKNSTYCLLSFWFEKNANFEELVQVLERLPGISRGSPKELFTAKFMLHMASYHVLTRVWNNYQIGTPSANACALSPIQSSSDMSRDLGARTEPIWTKREPQGPRPQHLPRRFQPIPASATPNSFIADFPEENFLTLARKLISNFTLFCAATGRFNTVRPPRLSSSNSPSTPTTIRKAHAWSSSREDHPKSSHRSLSNLSSSPSQSSHLAIDSLRLPFDLHHPKYQSSRSVALTVETNASTSCLSLPAYSPNTTTGTRPRAVLQSSSSPSSRRRQTIPTMSATPQVIDFQAYKNEYRLCSEELMSITTLLDSLEYVVPKESESVDLQHSITQHQERSAPKGKSTLLSRTLDSIASILVTDKEVISVQAKYLSAKVYKDEAVGTASQVGAKGKTERKTRSQDLVARVLICKNPHEHTEDKNTLKREMTEVRWVNITPWIIPISEEIYSFFTKEWDYGRGKSFEENLALVSALLNESMISQATDKMRKLATHVVMSSTGKLNHRYEKISSCIKALEDIRQVLNTETRQRKVVDFLEDEESMLLESTLYYVEDADAQTETQLLDAFGGNLTVDFGLRFLLALVRDIGRNNKKLSREIEDRKGSRAIQRTTDLLYEQLCSLEWFSFSRLSTKLFQITSSQLATALEKHQEEYRCKMLKKRGTRPHKMVLSTLKKGEKVKLSEAHIKRIKKVHTTEQEQASAIKVALEAEVAKLRKRSVYAEFTDSESDSEEQTRNEDDRTGEVLEDAEEDSEAREDPADGRPSIFPENPDESAAVYIRTCIRLLTVATRASRALALSKNKSDLLSEIRFEYIDTKLPSTNFSFNWMEYIDKLYPNAEYAKAVKRHLQSNFYNKFARKFINFNGRAHCEAISCSLCFELKKKTGTLDPSMYEQLKPIESFLEKEPIGVSKRSCPVCFTILDELYKHYEVQDVVNAGATHRVIFPCALPPGLPLQVAKNVVSRFRGLLKLRIAELGVIAKEASPQSDPVSREVTTGEEEAVAGWKAARRKDFLEKKRKREQQG